MPRFLLIILAALLILAGFVIWPRIDLTVSGWFFADGHFPLERNPVLLFMRDLAYYGARILGVVLLLLSVVTLMRRKPLFGIEGKGWAFLFLALVIGPGLIANVGLKDHWGRARPREITEFGGAKNFSPALVPQADGTTNSSFVSGDASFGFFLPSFAYVVPRRRNLSRRAFWCGMGVGALFSGCRLVMGAHFLSDILFAMALMLLSTAILHAVMFGRRLTAMCWRHWFFEAS